MMLRGIILLLSSNSFIYRLTLWNISESISIFRNIEIVIWRIFVTLLHVLNHCLIQIGKMKLFDLESHCQIVERVFSCSDASMIAQDNGLNNFLAFWRFRW